MPPKRPKGDILPVQKSKAKPKGVPRGTRLPQKHGGTLVVGAGGGPQPGSGRPPSILRERLKGALEARVPIIEQIADGTPIKVAEIPLATVLKYATCPKCNSGLEKLAALKAEDAVFITLRGKESASPSDRIRALDLAAKYGLGTKDEVTLISPDVRARVEATVQLITTRPSWDSESLLAELDKVWS